MLLMVSVERFMLKIFRFFKNIKFRLNCVSRHSVGEKYQKIRKIVEITLIATKIGYFAQLGIFGDFSGSRNRKLIC